MPPTPDRTTINDALDALIAQGRVALVATPPTPTAPFHRLTVGVQSDDAYPRPFLSLTIVQTETLGVVDDAKILRVTLEWRMFTDVSLADAHSQMVSKIGAVDDFFDGLIQAGVLEGAEGLDRRHWSMSFPVVTSGSRTASAAATQSMIVKVERNQNRVPAG